MPFTVKCSLARDTCFVVTLACASGFVTAKVNSFSERTW